MDLDQRAKNYVKDVAVETLDLFEEVATKAKSKLQDERVLGPAVLANINTMTSERALHTLDKIDQDNVECCISLMKEPAIARVVVETEEGEFKTYYICRSTPISGLRNLASYLAPVGRIASLPIGSTFDLPNGKIVEVLERTRLYPFTGDNGWDSRDSIFEADSFDTITVESLRKLIEEVSGTELDANLLEQLLSEESLQENFIKGIRRSIITKMALRDQPILDQFQDDIFRMPLNKRMLILGAPGTGKTTTLIRRLAQKIDTIFLAEDERLLVEKVGNTGGADHASSWLMFTPTELLRQYVQEAFARENVPASDLHIRTWQDYRRELARNVFGILRTAAGGGTFVLKDSDRNLNAGTIYRQEQWFTDFDEWQNENFFKGLREAAQLLDDRQVLEVQGMGHHLLSILDNMAESSLPSVFEALAEEVTKAQAAVSKLKDDTDTKIRGALNLQVNRNRAFLDELALFIDSLNQGQIAELEENEDFDSDDDEEFASPLTGRAAAVNSYMRAVRAQAIAYCAKRTLNKNSRNGKIVNWIGDRTLSEMDLSEVGQSLLVQASARRFVNPVKRYFNGVSKRYRAFRRLRQSEDVWYSKNTFDHKELHPLELDIVLLTILRSAWRLLRRANIIQNIDTPIWFPLKRISELFKNQIFVDEAPDFSSVQLASMYALTHPHIESFFACGDFNQRLTTWGARSIEDLKWVFNDIDIKEINVSYRQSKELNEFARAIILAVGGTDQKVSLPKHADNEAVAPVLLESASDLSILVKWLSERITEVERFIGQLPSIAIFVNKEEDTITVAEALNTALEDKNIRVVACPQGRVIGQENDVRVFDVQHIKGVEFEAVFFISIDQLADLQPDLFDKYLYVGATRAATYLGITCADVLPPIIRSLKPMFVKNWAN